MRKLSCCDRTVMKAFVIRKWWKQLFVVAKQEQHAQAQAVGGDCIAFAWRSHVAKRHYSAAKKIHAIKRKTLAIAVVQRSIKCHAARVAMRRAAEASAAAKKVKELGKALAYEVSGARDHRLLSAQQQQHQQCDHRYCCFRCCLLLHFLRCPVSTARWRQHRSTRCTTAVCRHRPSSTGNPNPASYV
jgi:hypothetical protein